MEVFAVSKIKLTEKQEHWRGHIETQKRSGLTRSKYCEANGLDLQQMGYYVSYLRKKAKAANGGGNFVRLSARPASTGVTIRLANGHSIECPSSLIGEMVKALS